MNDTDLADRLDRSFGTGPPLPGPHQHLAAGRRALLARRVGLVTASATVAAVVVTAVALTTGGSPATRSLDPATTAPSAPSSPAAESPSATATPSSRADVELTADGTLLVAEGVEVTQRIENPLRFDDPSHSLAIEYLKGATATWALLTYEPGPDGSATAAVASDPARKAFATLEDWVANTGARQLGRRPLQLVEFGAGETLDPLDGTRILEQTGDVALPDNFAGPDDRTAVALVVAEGDRWYVLARQLPGSRPEYFPTAASVGGATIADFLAYAEGHYAGGEGLR